MTQPTCETCRWWKPNEGSEYADDNGAPLMGDCRRRAPALWSFESTRSYLTGEPIWPVVDNVDWCGEHQPKYAESK